MFGGEHVGYGKRCLLGIIPTLFSPAVLVKPVVVAAGLALGFLRPLLCLFLFDTFLSVRLPAIGAPALAPASPALTEVLNLLDHLAETLFQIVHASQHEPAQHILAVILSASRTETTRGIRHLRCEAGRRGAHEAPTDGFVVSQI